MKFKNPLLVVKDMDASVEFYKNVLGLHKIMDLGANVTLTGGVCLQTLDTWKEFIGTEEIIFGARDTELYFEEDDFDKFLEKLESLDLDYVHPVREHSWGQRVLRFYDPDQHVIEVGENMKSVCRKFLDGGMTPEQAAERMGVPLKFVKGCMRKKLADHPLDVSRMAPEQLNAELEKGYADIQAERTRPASEVFTDIRKEFKSLA